MKKQILICFVYLTLANFSLSQGESNNWYFGSFAGITFNTNPPSALLNGAISTSEGCATMSDANGNLLFYTDGIRVYNSNHQMMANGNNLLGDPSSAQSGIIIPKPGSTTNYYIVTVPETGSIGMRYSEVNMTLNGGLGDVLPGNKNTMLFAPSSEKVAVVKHANGVYFWIIGRTNGQGRDYYSFLIDCDGVNTTPVISANVSTTIGENWGYLVPSPDGSKLASASTVSGVEIADFDNLTGLVSNNLYLGNSVFAGVAGGNYGVAFSQSGNVLYATSITNWALIQWNLQAANIPASMTFINYTMGGGNVRPAYRGGALQLANDGKIYVAETGLASLGTIHNPEVIGTGCNFLTQQVNLQGRTCLLGLPPFIASFFLEDTQIEILSSNTCVQDPVQFGLNSTILDSVLWNFGDPASGTNVSTLVNPSHQFSAPGTYTVQAIRYVNCVSDTLTTPVIIHDYKRTSIDITLCPNEIYTSPSGALISAIGTYIDTIPSTSNPLCDSIITINILPVSPQLQLTNDTTICFGTSIQLLASGAVQYLWDTDPTLSDITIANPIATPTQTTTYYVSSSFKTTNNLVFNGDFELGNTGFTTQYNSPAPTLTQGQYAVGSTIDNTWFNNCGDHTSGTGNMMIVDASCGTFNVAPSVNIWCQEIEVQPNSNYEFSVFVANASTTNNSPVLGVFIDGVQVSTYAHSMNQGCNWIPFTAIWSNPGATSINLCIRELSGLCQGVDFILDDISLYKICDYRDSVTVRVSNPVTTIDNFSNPTCNSFTDGQIVSSTTGGILPYNYSWNNDPSETSASIDSIGAGSYTIVVTDSVGCQSTSNLDLTEPTPLQTQVDQLTNALCNQSADGTATTTTTGGTLPYIYQWNTTPIQATANAINLQAGQYTLTATDSNNCVLTTTITITEPLVLSLDLNQVTNLTCFESNDGQAEVVANGGTLPYSYSWNTSPVQTTASSTGLTAGSFTCTVTDSNNCTAQYTATVTQPDLLQVIITPSLSTICPDSSSTLVASATGGTLPYSIIWNENLPANNWNPIVTPTTNTTYEATVTDSNGCLATINQHITQVVLPQVQFTVSEDVGCIPFTTTFTNNSAGVYNTCAWDFGNQQVASACSSNVVTYQQTGCYDITLTLTTQQGCVATLTQNDLVCAVPQPEASIVPNLSEVTTTNPLVVFSNLSTDADTYTWDFGDGTISTAFATEHAYSEYTGGTYTVVLEANNQYGCVDYDSVIIRVREDVLFWIPNSFTPDGDHFNQVFKPIITQGVDPFEYSFLVYNRWGEIIFESHAIEVGWDGTYGGTTISQSGTYSWTVSMKVKNLDKRITQVGTVNLLR